MEEDLSKHIKFWLKISLVSIIIIILLAFIGCKEPEPVKAPITETEEVIVLEDPAYLGTWQVTNTEGQLIITKDSIYFDFGMFPLSKYMPYVFIGDTLKIIYYYPDTTIYEPYFLTHFDEFTGVLYQMYRPDYVMHDEYYEVIKQ